MMMRTMLIAAMFMIPVPICAIAQTYGTVEVPGTYWISWYVSALELELRPDGTYRLEQFDDVGSPWPDRVFGSYKVEGRRITLTPPERGCHLVACFAHGFPNELLIAPWGPRTYLLKPDERIEFCNAMNTGWEPAFPGLYSSFFTRDGDHDLDVSGKPDLPEGWSSCILDEPIIARVLEFGPETVVINVGKAESVFPGMWLMVVDAKGNMACDLKVKSCTEHRSVASYGESCRPHPVWSAVVSRWEDYSQ